MKKENNVIGRVENLLGHILEVSSTLKDDYLKVYTLKLSDNILEKCKNDLKSGLIVGCSYDDNFNITKLTYLKAMG